MTGPKEAPKKPQAHSTSSMMPSQLGLVAIMKATTAIMTTTILPAHIISLLEAFLRITAL